MISHSIMIILYDTKLSISYLSPKYHGNIVCPYNLIQGVYLRALPYQQTAKRAAPDYSCHLVTKLMLIKKFYGYLMFIDYHKINIALIHRKHIFNIEVWTPPRWLRW